jgi:hypothetical protein
MKVYKVVLISGLMSLVSIALLAATAYVVVSAEKAVW